MLNKALQVGQILDPPTNYVSLSAMLQSIAKSYPDKEIGRAHV